MNPKRNRNRLLCADSVNKFIGQFPDLTYDGAKVICLVCHSSIVCRNQRDCFRHVNTKQHKHTKCHPISQKEFVLHTIYMLTACNLPFRLVEKEPFREFWRTHNADYELPSARTLRNYLPAARGKMEISIKSALKLKKLWLSCDESTVCKKKSILNVIVRILEPLQQSSSFLLASRRLSKCTGEAIHSVILSTLEKFELTTSQIIMFVTDASSSMLSAGRFLKHECPTLLHVTCLLHGLHLVVETIRQNYPNVDGLISNTKKVFQKSPTRIRDFHKHCPGIREPPQSIHTRWGTWLEAVSYYYNNFHTIKSLVLQFNPNESIAIKESQIKFNCAGVHSDLQTIHTSYTVLANGITTLQNTSLALVDQLKVVDEVQTMLSTLNDEISVFVLEKFRNVLGNNSDFTRLRDIYSNTSSTDKLSQFKEYFNYAIITSVDGKRSFSLYKNIFTPRRTSFNEKNLETYAMLQMFSLAR